MAVPVLWSEVGREEGGGTRRAAAPGRHTRDLWSWLLTAPAIEPVFLPRERGERACGDTVEAGDGHRRRTVCGDGRRQPHWLASDRAAARGGGCCSDPVRQLRARLPRGGGEPGAGPAGDGRARRYHSPPRVAGRPQSGGRRLCPGR